MFSSVLYREQWGVVVAVTRVLEVRDGDGVVCLMQHVTVAAVQCEGGWARTLRKEKRGRMKYDGSV